MSLHPSFLWSTTNGPIEDYVLADLYSWIESHSGFTNHATTVAHVASTSSSNSTAK